MGEGYDFAVMWSVVPTGQESAGFILPVIGIFSLAVNKEVVLDKEYRSVNEFDVCHEGHGRTITAKICDFVTGNNVGEFADGVIKHGQALAVVPASIPFLLGQISMP